LRLEREFAVVVAIKGSVKKEDLEWWGMRPEVVKDAIKALREQQRGDDGLAR
jgi:hypothetical protein